jgi:hypothetical protein
MKAALNILHYIHSTHDYGISFTSNDAAPMHSYVHYPPSSDAEAYKDAIPPTKSSANTLTATAMHAEVPNWVLLLLMAPSFRCSNFAV